MIRLKFDNHDLLLLKDVRDEPYESISMGPGAPIRWIPQPWASGLDQSRLLGLINMPHFGRFNESHACLKQLLSCFHGGTLWLNTLIPVTVYLITSIIGLPKAGEDLA